MSWQKRCAFPLLGLIFTQAKCQAKQNLSTQCHMRAVAWSLISYRQVFAGGERGVCFLPGCDALFKTDWQNLHLIVAVIIWAVNKEKIMATLKALYGMVSWTVSCFTSCGGKTRQALQAVEADLLWKCAMNNALLSDSISTTNGQHQNLLGGLGMDDWMNKSYAPKLCEIYTTDSCS